MGTEDNLWDKERGRALATLRGILVSSLSRENLPLDLGDSLSLTSPPLPPARRRRRVTFLEGGAAAVHDNDGYDDHAGAAPVDPSQKQTSRPSSAKQGGLHWFAHGADEPVSAYNEGSYCDLRHSREQSTEVCDGSSFLEEGKENAAVTQKDREERLRLLKERQNEDRQKKLEELKLQALAAQKFREQKEEERRRRMEELRSRDSDRRHQVEERKRQIWEAERDRREAILRKNQEREARIESKRKNERSSIVFAFGSSTPRMLEPADTGGSYWATRRATSTSNVMMLSMTAPPGPLTRRSSERELDGSKKRATSAGGINRSKGEDGWMSSSIYEVFQWDSPPSKSPCNTAPLSLVDNSSQSISQQSPQQADLANFKNKSLGDEGDGTSNNMTAAAIAAARAAARRKTDLMPTIPSPRDRDLTPGRPQSSRTMRSPGRAYSMSRLDILARPRKRTLQPPSPATPDPNLSRSMISLAQQQPTTLRRANTSRSMSQLSAPIPPPRPTRAERLRRKAREAASRSQSLEQTPTSPGLRSGEATPSRPQSALSQHSVSSVIGMTTSCTSANIRTRPVAAPRRPRPYSIAVTGISSSSPSDSPRQSLSSEHRAATAAAAASKSASAGGTDKPPLPRVHTTKKPLSAKPGDVSKKPTDKIKSSKSSAASTPKATPLQSPGVEVAPSSHSDETLSVTTVTSVTTVGNETHTETVTVAVSEITSQSETVIPHGMESSGIEDPSKDRSLEKPQLQQVVIDKQPTKQENEFITAPPQQQQQLDVSTSELIELDMTASMIARTRITTEEEAKAALAERRRLAREQAEREAELERQRLEVERLAEEERLRQEEEEQRRAEEEQLRLLEEARLAEEQRLQIAIGEAQKREEEERRRREEEERLRKEKEEADKKAKEEAEKLRQEMEIKLKKEEEDRQARRKRVEAIMLRTRGKGPTPSNTPTKDDGEEPDESPGEYNKNENKNMNIQEEFLHSERNHSAAITSDPIIQQPPPTSNPFLDSINMPKHNGHRNGVDNETVVQNNVTNNLLDFSSFETTNVNNVSVAQPSVGEILQPLPADNIPITPTNGKLSNEDNLNFNSQPFIAFQDNKKQDSNTVNDLLS